MKKEKIRKFKKVISYGGDYEDAVSFYGTFLVILLFSPIFMLWKFFEAIDDYFKKRKVYWVEVSE